MDDKLIKLKNGPIPGWLSRSPKLQKDGSFIDDDTDQFWLNDAGEIHREDGPAIIFNIEPVVYWVLNNIRYRFDDWLNELGLSEEWDTYYRLIYPDVDRDREDLGVRYVIPFRNEVV